MATYYAEMTYSVLLTVKVDMPDGEEPTEEDIREAASLTDNYCGEHIFYEKIISVEKE